jgi:hypothetical protein
LRYNILMRYLLLIWTLCLNCAWGQDEKLIRNLLTGKIKDNAEQVQLGHNWKVSGPAYHIDLNGDGTLEKLFVSKKDGQDSLSVLDNNLRRVFKANFPAKGRKSGIYRLRVVSLSSETKVIVVYYNEGHSDHVNFYSSARLYFISMDYNVLESLKVQEGPQFWDERVEYKDHYHRRHYDLIIHDYNKDGIKDFAVKYGKITRIYMYKGRGKWLIL